MMLMIDYGVFYEFIPMEEIENENPPLLGALVGLARSTVNEPKTEDTDRILAAGLRLAAAPEAAESALLRICLLYTSRCV